VATETTETTVEEVEFLRLTHCGPVPEEPIALQRGLEGYRRRVRDGGKLYTAQEGDPTNPASEVNAIRFTIISPSANHRWLDRSPVLAFEDKVWGRVCSGDEADIMWGGEIAIRFDAMDSEHWITYSPFVGPMADEAKAGLKLLSGE